MAKPEKKTGDEAEESKGGSPLIMILIAAVVAAVIGAGGAFFVLSKQEIQAPTGPTPEEIAAAEAKREAEGAGFRDRLYSLDPFVVNVTGDGYNRFLKVKVDLEADTPELKGEIEARLSQIRDAMIVLLSSKQLADITDFEGKALLKEDILDRVNDVLETGEVSEVLFTEFVVQ